MPRPLLTALAAALVIALLAACGEDRKRISSPRIPFTFEVPEDYKRVPVRPGSSQGTPPILAVGADRLNVIDVRQSAPREVPLDRVARQVAASLDQLGFSNAEAKRESHAGRDMLRFDVDNRVRGTATRSRLYFFTGGGKTWELECQSAEDGRGELEDACEDAVNSVEFQ